MINQEAEEAFQQYFSTVDFRDIAAVLDLSKPLPLWKAAWTAAIEHERERVKPLLACMRGHISSCESNYICVDCDDFKEAIRKYNEGE
jgi:hypothetical protein